MALCGYFALARFGRQAAVLWLVLASLVFYGWMTPELVPLLLISIAFNFTVARLLERTRPNKRLQTWVLRFGVAANLTALVYYKYLIWLIDLAVATGLTDIAAPMIVLPLGISFFTFTQLGYLMDVRAGTTQDRSLTNYAVFVTFFPHLVAGPILHNRDIMPQFADQASFRFSARNMSVGLGIFIIGLFKKIALADPVSVGVAEAFAHPDGLSLFAAWQAALCYSLQLYFDFSGYSDMAIGLARMFNIRFPLNFNSPYKARSVVEYWQRWHMSLTRYLTQYIYNPLTLRIMRRWAAKRIPLRLAQSTLKGFAMTVALPIYVTIGLAGIWHGSGAQFLVFGLLHATYMAINRAWGLVFESDDAPGWFGVVWRVALTYLSVLVAAVFFRAPSVANALSLLGGMIGLHGGGLLVSMDHEQIISTAKQIVWLVGLYGIVWGLPNTQQLFILFAPTLETVEAGWPSWLVWRPTLVWGILLGGVGMLLTLFLGGVSEFLYFQF